MYCRRLVSTSGGSGYGRCYYDGSHRPRSAIRRPRKNKTKEAQAEHNRRASLDKLTWKLNENFRVDDLWISLTYKPPFNKERTYEQMLKDLRLFFAKMRRAEAKLGEKFRCMYSVEVGKRGSRHFHMVAPAAFKAAIRKAWKLGIADIREVRPQEDCGTYDKIAEYMIKSSDKTRKTLENDRIPRYNGTRNLKQPPVEVKELRRDLPPEDQLYCPKGWRIVPDSVKKYENEYGYLTIDYVYLRC